MKKIVFLGVLLLACALVASADIVDYNLANRAWDFGVMPGITLAQGVAKGIADGFTYRHWGLSWSGGIHTYTSPTTADGVNENDVYMLWSTPKTVRSVKFVGDLSTTYDEIRLYSLNAGGNPANYADWTQIWYALGLSSVQLLMIDLADDYVLNGLRIYVHRNGGDGRTPICEVAVYGPMGINGDKSHDDAWTGVDPIV